MDDWVLWLIAAVVFGVGEIATTGFFLAPFAGAALIAAVLAAVGAPAVLTWSAFLVASVALLLALRPVAKRMVRTPARLRTGTAALVGRPGTVIERVDMDAGCVRIDGDVWSARPYMDDEVYEPGARVQVVEIRGATALITD